MLDALAAGLRECNSKPFVGAKLELNSFLENMLTSRISRRVLAEQHINLHNRRCRLCQVPARPSSRPETSCYALHISCLPFCSNEVEAETKVSQVYLEGLHLGTCTN